MPTNAFTHTHSYAGSSSVGGSATSAVKLDSSAGSATQPVYFSGGKPVACTYTLGKSVPSNAVFTDTHYTTHLYVGASGGNANATSATNNPYLLCVDNTTNRNSVQLKASSNMSISAVNGVVTFTATDTWRGIQNNLTSDSTIDSLSAAQGKVLKGLVDGKADSSHTHSYLPLSGGEMTGNIITPKDDNMGIIPNTNNYGQIGSSDKKFYRMYATTFYGALSGNASTATKLLTARTIALTGSVTGSGTFDGSGNLSIATTTNHTHSYFYR